MIQLMEEGSRDPKQDDDGRPTIFLIIWVLYE